MAEAALVMPLLLLILLGILQAVILAYGAATVRYAAFAALRAAAVSPAPQRGTVARSAAAAILSAVPAVRLVAVVTQETPLPLRGAALVTPRMTCRIVARVPRIMPLSITPLTTVQASAAMPMEPSR
jgi:hypothetical protein